MKLWGLTLEAAKLIPDAGYKQFLNKYGIKGKRLSVVRHPLLDSLNSSIVSTFGTHLDILRYRFMMLRRQ